MILGRDVNTQKNDECQDWQEELKIVKKVYKNAARATPGARLKWNVVNRKH